MPLSPGLLAMEAWSASRCVNDAWSDQTGRIALVMTAEVH